MIYAIVGPTCSGKSSLAIMLAQYFNAEIINCDPFQCYKELNIGVAKPNSDELALVKHNLINIVSITDKFTIYDFQKEFRKCLNNLILKEKNVVIVGGSGLYLRSALFDYTFHSNSLSEKRVSNDLLNKTNEELHSILKEIDQLQSEKIHINNRKRLIRAIEIYNETGKTKSEIESLQEHKILYDVNIIGLNIERQKLYDDINNRVDKMFEIGLENECKELFSKYSPSLTALQAIGYKEFLLSNDPNVIKELIKKNTRNYAKRQMTFFKHQFENIVWFNSPKEAYNTIVGIKNV